MVMAPLKLITPPTTWPITLAEAKQHLRVDHDDEDEEIQWAIEGATEYIDGKEGYLGRALMVQTWELTLDAFPIREIKIPLPPLIDVVNVFYDDAGGIATILDPAGYSVDNVSEPGWIVPVGSWPTPFDGINSVRIRYRAGYVDNSVSPAVGRLPSDIRSALLLY